MLRSARKLGLENQYKYRLYNHWCLPSMHLPNRVGVGAGAGEASGHGERVRYCVLLIRGSLCPT